MANQSKDWGAKPPVYGMKILGQRSYRDLDRNIDPAVTAPPWLHQREFSG